LAVQPLRPGSGTRIAGFRYNDGVKHRPVEEMPIMAAPAPGALLPLALRREGAERLIIEWNDGHRSVYTWKHLRANCPCASCREEREKPPDPFRILKPAELLPLAPVGMPAVGRYAYKIVWSDGHETGIFTLDLLRSLCQCPQCEQDKT
jgi:DUF971 family protein